MGPHGTSSHACRWDDHARGGARGERGRPARVRGAGLHGQLPGLDLGPPRARERGATAHVEPGSVPSGGPARVRGAPLGRPDYRWLGGRRTPVSGPRKTPMCATTRRAPTPRVSVGRRPAPCSEGRAFSFPPRGGELLGVMRAGLGFEFPPHLPGRTRRSSGGSSRTSRGTRHGHRGNARSVGWKEGVAWSGSRSSDEGIVPMGLPR